MADEIIAHGSESKYATHEAGQFVAQCVDVVNLGHRLRSFSGDTPYLAPTCALVFRTGEKSENGNYIDVSQEFTVSMSDRANLRKFLEQWRGKAYTPEQIEQGVPLHKLAGQHALLTIAHKQTQKGRAFAVITAAVGVPKAMLSVATVYSDYERAEFWAKRKAEYAAEASQFVAKRNTEPTNGAPPLDDDDNIPF